MTAVTNKPFPRRRNGVYFLDNEKYTSVTEILSVLSKPALIPWAARTSAALVLDDPVKYDTAEKAAAGIYQVRDKAADRGALIHSWIEAYAKGAPLYPDEMPEAFQGYARAFLAWVEGSGFNSRHILQTEANVYSDKGYAGTTDLITGLHDKIWMLDFKTSKDGAIYQEAHLQLAAYKHADFILTRDTPPMRVPMPAIDSTGVVALAADGTFNFKQTDAPFEVFLYLKAVHEWLKKGV